jgi:uncharacterized protein YjbI with pentapeptide repeats
MHFESETYGDPGGNGPKWDDNFYRFCVFESISTEGSNNFAFFDRCEFSKCEWYWGHFNGAHFVNVKFRSCTFRGSFFSDCKFVECEFEDCTFTEDNLGAGCTFNEIKWFDCRQTNCVGIENEFKNPT